MFTAVPLGMSPILDGVRIFLALLLLLPFYVLLDSLRPWRHAVEADFDEPKEGMYGYTWMSGILIIVGLSSYVPSILVRLGVEIGAVPGAISGLALFLMIVLFFAYLKRVVLNPYMRRYRKEIRRQKKLEAAGTPVEAGEYDKEEVLRHKKSVEKQRYGFGADRELDELAETAADTSDDDRSESADKNATTKKKKEPKSDKV